MMSPSSWIKQSLNLSRQLIVQQVAPLACLVGLSCFINITAQDALQSIPLTQETERWLLQLGLGIWDLVEGILLLLVLSWGIPKVRTLAAATMLEKPFSTPYIGSFFAEFLRSLAQILLWGLLLILPGVYRYAQLIFVSWVTLFSKDYRAGKVDALRLSETLARGRLLKIFLALGITMLFEVLFDFLPEMVNGLHEYPYRILFFLCSSLVGVWGFSLIFLLFEEAMESLLPKEVTS